jgi:hypothetical protein
MNWKLYEPDEDADIFTKEEFKASVKCGAFIDYDGYGCELKKDEKGNWLRGANVSPSKISGMSEETTHVDWFNR